MKIQLTKTADEHTQTGYQAVLYRKIKDAVENGTCEEIIANDCLDFIVERGGLLQNIIHKMAYNGTLIIYGLNIDQICQQMFCGKLTSAEFNQIMYGNKRQSCDSCRGLVIGLESFGLKILSVRMEDNYYCIKAQRTKNG